MPVAGDAARLEAEARRLAEAEREQAARAEAVRAAEAARAEAARAEAARVEAARAEAARVEAARAEAARVEATRVEAARAEAARVEATRVEAARAEAARPPEEAPPAASPLPKGIVSDNDAPLRDAHLRGTFTTTGQGFTVRLLNPALGIDLVVPCEPGEYVLEAADRAGYELPSSCRNGGCLTCAGKLQGGGETDMIEQYTLEEEHIAEGFRLLCCTTVRSDATFVTHQQDEIH